MRHDPKEILTFEDYLETTELKPALRVAFEAHLRLHGGFSHATRLDWDRKRSEFLTMHRGRGN